MTFHKLFQFGENHPTEVSPVKSGADVWSLDGVEMSDDFDIALPSHHSVALLELVENAEVPTTPDINDMNRLLVVHDPRNCITINIKKKTE